jgi:uncharacterized membrane protein YkoI
MEDVMKTRRLSYVATVGLVLGMAAPGFSEDGVILLAQLGSKVEQRMTRDQAIAKATKIKQGNVLKATLEKRDNQVVWEVKIEDGNRNISAVQIDPKSQEIIKSIDNVGGK